MNNIMVINASPLFLLGKADFLKTMSPLAKTWIIPDGVIHKVQAKRPIDPYLSGLASNSEPGLLSNAWQPLDCTSARPCLLVYWLELVKQIKGIKKKLKVNLDNLQTAESPEVPTDHV